MLILKITSLVFLIALGLAIAIALLGSAILLFVGLGYYFTLIAGVICGVFLWRAGHDNLGVISVIAGFALAPTWLNWYETKIGSASTSSPDPMDGKRKIYDKDGNITGYQD